MEALQRVLGELEKSKAAKSIDAAAPTGRTPIGAWVNRRRLTMRLSVSELSASTGISLPALYNIEAGRSSNPRAETIRKLEKALGESLPSETKDEAENEATIEGVGALTDFDPHDDLDRPASPGIYVLYDVSDRPLYVGEGRDIRKRLRDHSDKFWFRPPIVAAAAYVQIDDEALRRKIEALMIRFLKSNAVINKQHVDR